MTSPRQKANAQITKVLRPFKDFAASITAEALGEAARHCESPQTARLLMSARIKVLTKGWSGLDLPNQPEKKKPSARRKKKSDEAKASEEVNVSGADQPDAPTKEAKPKVKAEPQQEADTTEEKLDEAAVLLQAASVVEDDEKNE